MSSLFIVQGSIVPGSSRTYQEICTEHVRDFMIEKQVEYIELVASQVVVQIRVHDLVN